MSTVPNWRKSSYSGGQNDACIEVADNQPSVLVRDSKLSDASPVIRVTPFAWSTFIKGTASVDA
ncbi:hypothetical protein SSP35_04_04140 [Streptomyces sp. NBRC 110611]|uniref:DUF397 domain-containing protein n=1 Tax=Streptomyces sp. NBRC 110611 TaxID=1621259 RepID=UPI0008312894|nr:DUF397 domain-containing protein [Streptomyces sp. NBRC 110611]GAU67326.1 hypothetical protein SSP35_04_04140 [Streptomyces sp. NBRC 110611]